RHLWTRTIGSTAVGQLVDSALFYPIAFFGTWQPGTMMEVIAFNWAFKVSVEIVFTPVTYAVVRWLKHQENEDWYDRQTNFTPFSLKD
ncbi:MAG: VUT family protein, partial [Nitrospira sp.]|nr:VUT family protein [Nitrospira sp.]